MFSHALRNRLLINIDCLCDVCFSTLSALSALSALSSLCMCVCVCHQFAVLFECVCVCVCVCVEKHLGKCCVPTSTRMSLPRIVISASHLSNYDTSSWKTYSHPSNPRGPPDLDRKCRMRSSLPSKPKSRAAGCPRAEVSRSKKVGF